MFPNLADKEVFFTFDVPKDITEMILNIYSNSGQLLSEKMINPVKGILRVDISTFDKGNYIAEIKSRELIILTTKFVKM